MPLRPFRRDQGWLLPPSLDEMLPQDHPARFVDAVLESLSAEKWDELGMDMEGDPAGAPAYHPRALLGIWIYGFMTGTRSSRKLEDACRDQLPYAWLGAMARPDHNTLWRFWRAHRDDMRRLLSMTVHAAARMGLVELAFQAVDGTRVAASASRDRTLDEAGLRRLLARVEVELDALEAQNGAENEPPSPRLPEELADKRALQRRVQDALDEVGRKGGPRHANLTDPDARLLKIRGGYTTGYNAQAMVSPLKPGGMLITAVDVTNTPSDHPHLLRMIERAASNMADTGKAEVTLADAGYHSGPNLASCAMAGHRVLMPEAQASKRKDPYHRTNFIHLEDQDAYLCPEGQLLSFKGLQDRPEKGYLARRYRAEAKVCAACPAFGECTKSVRGRVMYVTPDESLLREHRALMESEKARALYRMRKQTVEPVFGIVKEQMGARRFLLRGLANVNAEWSLLAAAFNLRSLGKIWSKRLLNTTNR
ncbi:MAG: IS1182 family transposase, partial [Chloroflexi bacterium]|nr:IS1182 family transposase [Chloroflexota bacterium]